jgi:hypothetical protein
LGEGFGLPVAPHKCCSPSNGFDVPRLIIAKKLRGFPQGRERLAWETFGSPQKGVWYSTVVHVPELRVLGTHVSTCTHIRGIVVRVPRSRACRYLSVHVYRNPLNPAQSPWSTAKHPFAVTRTCNITHCVRLLREVAPRQVSIEHARVHVAVHEDRRALRVVACGCMREVKTNMLGSPKPCFHAWKHSFPMDA